jgi:hypothetical protein
MTKSTAIFAAELPTGAPNIELDPALFKIWKNLLRCTTSKLANDLSNSYLIPVFDYFITLPINHPLHFELIKILFQDLSYE